VKLFRAYGVAECESPSVGGFDEVAWHALKIEQAIALNMAGFPRVTNTRRGNMKTMLMFRAGAMLLPVGIGSAHAGNASGRSVWSPDVLIRAPGLPKSIVARRTSPLVPFGGVEVLVLAPMASPDGV
jgi:hypothetical protein